MLAANADTDSLTGPCCFQIVLCVSVSFHQPHHKPLEGMTKLNVSIQQIATEISIAGKSKGVRRNSTAEMPNAHVCQRIGQRER